LGIDEQPKLKPVDVRPVTQGLPVKHVRAVITGILAIDPSVIWAHVIPAHATTMRRAAKSTDLVISNVTACRVSQDNIAKMSVSEGFSIYLKT